MRKPAGFGVLIFALVAIVIILGILIVKTGGTHITSLGEKACQMDAESRNLEWRYSAFSGCQVLTKSGAWIPLAQFDHPSQVP
jgi:hypothetical protein